MQQSLKAWPFELASRVLEAHDHLKDNIMLCTGYGPSGLPHIGTYCEVMRTKMVQNAIDHLCNKQIPTRLVLISDDMDGLRKIPSNLPNAEMLQAHLQQPLTSVPDPFGECASYGDYMNAKCCNFLDRFGFAYEFFSATKLYKSGTYDEHLMRILEKYDEVMEIMLPTLGDERQQTYSPFLPICPRTGRVLYVPIIERSLQRGTIVYVDPDTNAKEEVKVTGGSSKLQWKPDFGMRWAALDVDFEMYGKDHRANSKIYTSICKLVGGKGPVQFCYEMFLDADGRKISKSSGNGLSVEEWLECAPIESLAFYMYQHPQRAKKLHFSAIPKSVDDYISCLQDKEMPLLENPAWHVHLGQIPDVNLHGVTFSLLVNLASVCSPATLEVIRGFVGIEGIDDLIAHAITYCEKYVKHTKLFRAPTPEESQLLLQLAQGVLDAPRDASAADLQKIFYSVGKQSHFTELVDFFHMVYQVLFGQIEGPRLGSFAKLYGAEKMAQLLKEKANTL